jgi:hypothetical protein
MTAYSAYGRASHQVKDKEFKGSKVFVHENSRMQLPFLRPDEPVPFFRILKNLIG